MARSAKPQVKENPRACETAGCAGEAEFRAPKTRDEKTDYFWFCLDCVKDYNKKWDYFRGMNEEQIEEFRQEAVHGHRPTWKMHISPRDAADMIADKINAMLGDGFIRKPSPLSRLPKKTQRALEALEMEEYPASLDNLKSQYKKLVKLYHPDVNRGDPASEERFKKVTEAYSVLLAQYQQENRA